MQNSSSPLDSPSELPVAVDAAGGDHGLQVIVEGAVQAYREFNVRSTLVGNQDEILDLLQAFDARDLPITVQHASEVITMEESPTRSIRRKPDSSLCVAYKLVESGQASSIISAGNSGAMMAAGLVICGLLPSIERPAIATLIPVAGDDIPNVILDSGANIDCHARNLMQFAIMGTIYHRSLFGSEHPKVALLSNGSEQSKGTDIIRAASIVLAQLKHVNYVGYVEGRDIPTRAADVIVCDGFVGNIVLKAMEGCVRLISDQLMLEANKGLFRKVGMGLSKKMYKEVFTERFDYTSYGGAPLLGLRKLALVLHGSSDARAVKNAIRVADTFVRNGMNQDIQRSLAELEEDSLESVGDFLPSGMTQQKLSPKDRQNHGRPISAESAGLELGDSKAQRPPSEGQLAATEKEQINDK